MDPISTSSRGGAASQHRASTARASRNRSERCARAPLVNGAVQAVAVRPNARGLPPADEAAGPEESRRRRPDWETTAP